MVETISIYSIPGLTCLIAWQIGIDAWPPHEIIFMLSDLRHSSKLTTGQHVMPNFAGVMSIIRIPFSLQRS